MKYMICYNYNCEQQYEYCDTLKEVQERIKKLRKEFYYEYYICKIIKHYRNKNW